MLWCARATCATVALGATALLFAIGHLTAGPLAGALTALLFAYNPLALLLCRRAMAESTLLFFSLSAVLAQVCFLSRRRPRQRWPVVALFVLAEGSCLACAVGTKLNGALVAIAFAVTMLAVCMRDGIHSLRYSRHAVHRGEPHLVTAFAPMLVLLAVVGVAVAVFVLANPFLYPAAGKGFVELTRSAGGALAGAYRAFPEDSLGTLRAKAMYVYRELCQWKGVPFASILAGSAYTGLLASGFGLLFAREVRSFVRGRPSAGLPVFVWVMTSIIGVTVWLPADWNRLLAPLVPCTCYLVGLSVGSMLELGRRVMRHWTATQSAPSASWASFPAIDMGPRRRHSRHAAWTGKVLTS